MTYTYAWGKSEQVICAGCGARFKRHRPTRMYCSYRCKNQAAKRRMYARLDNRAAGE